MDRIGSMGPSGGTQPSSGGYDVAAYHRQLTQERVAGAHTASVVDRHRQVVHDQAGERDGSRQDGRNGAASSSAEIDSPVPAKPGRWRERLGHRSCDGRHGAAW